MPKTSITTRSIVATVIIAVAVTLTGCSTNAEPGTRGLAEQRTGTSLTSA